MTTEQLKTKVSVKPVIQARLLITIKYRGKKYSCFSANHLAFIRILLANQYKKREIYYYTLKNAYQAFYDECKAKNKIKVVNNIKLKELKWN